MPEPHSPRRPLAAPRAPEVPGPHGFPLIAVLAPVFGSLLIWAITRSPFALIFALLGPLVAIASVADARIQSRRTKRRESARFEREVTATGAAIDRLHSEERDILLRAAPGALGIPTRPTHDPERWRPLPTDGVPVRLGVGRAPSALRLDVPAAPPTGDDPVQRALEILHRAASVVEGVPVTVDARLGVGVCGPGALVQAVARGILLQLADRLSPLHAMFVPDGAAARLWTSHLPHRSADPGGASSGEQETLKSQTSVRWSCGDESGIVAVAARVEDLPADCRVVVRVAGRTAQVIRCPENAGVGSVPFALAAELVSAEQTAELGAFLRAAAASLGFAPVGAEGADPSFEGLPCPDQPAGSGSLACVFARAVDGGEAITIDLAAQGPHAVVGGTTGSGKSELLVSWVLATARAHPPSVVNFLLVDFKGGASFAPIRSLPHVVGIVTDLDERTAQRAMLSLRAELRYRERVIADAGARSIDDSAVDLPRLVIVVDEFAALAGEYPQLHELFGDLAARGRSLGLHLILCTQRPAGVIRDAVLANATLRVSLRVNNRADSIAVLGTAQAAELRADLPGRAWISVGGEVARLVRVARVTETDVREVVEQRSAAHRSHTPATIRRPWCDDLGTAIPLSVLEGYGDGIPFALVDLPELQKQETAHYDPARSGGLLVIGATGAGKSELLATLGCAPGVEELPSAWDEAWDAVETALGRVRAGMLGPRLLLADDLDALVGRFPEEYQAAFVDRLVELARDGSGAGLQFGFSVRRITPALQSLASLCDERIILRLGSRQDHLMAGGSATGFVPDAPAGGGEWRGSRIQVALGPRTRREATGAPPVTLASGRQPPADAFDLSGCTSVAVVTTRVAEFARRLRAIDPPLDLHLLSAGYEGRAGNASVDVVGALAPTVIVGDPDGWQANWALLAALRRGRIVLDRCSVAEFRAISGRRILPPPIRSGTDQCLVMEPDGSVRRMLVPSAAPPVRPARS